MRSKIGIKMGIKVSTASLALLAMATIAYAGQENSLKKIVDGSVRQCSSAADVNGDVNVQMSLKGSALSINLVKCEVDATGAGRFVLDYSAAEKSYKAVNGEKVDVNYSNFELVLVDRNSQVLEIHSLKNLPLTSQETLKIDKIESGTEMFIRAVRSFKSESGIADKYLMSWGAYRF